MAPKETDLRERKGIGHWTWRLTRCEDCKGEPGAESEEHGRKNKLMVRGWLQVHFGPEQPVGHKGTNIQLQLELRSLELEVS